MCVCQYAFVHVCVNESEQVRGKKREGVVLMETHLLDERFQNGQTAIAEQSSNAHYTFKERRVKIPVSL